jgi:gluconolactonase
MRMRIEWMASMSLLGRFLAPERGCSICDADTSVSSAATAYAFDVIERSGGVFLVNKRVFAYSLTRSPAGIVCDSLGNVYIGCADGVEIFNAGGGILGVIEVPGEFFVNFSVLGRLS